MVSRAGRTLLHLEFDTEPLVNSATNTFIADFTRSFRVPLACEQYSIRLLNIQLPIFSIDTCANGRVWLELRCPAIDASPTSSYRYVLSGFCTIKPDIYCRQLTVAVQFSPQLNRLFHEYLPSLANHPFHIIEFAYSDGKCSVRFSDAVLSEEVRKDRIACLRNFDLFLSPLLATHLGFAQSQIPIRLRAGERTLGLNAPFIHYGSEVVYVTLPDLLSTSTFVNDRRMSVVDKLVLERDYSSLGEDYAREVLKAKRNFVTAETNRTYRLLVPTLDTIRTVLVDATGTPLAFCGGNLGTISMSYELLPPPLPIDNDD